MSAQVPPPGVSHADLPVDERAEIEADLRRRVLASFLLGPDATPATVVRISRGLLASLLIGLIVLVGVGMAGLVQTAISSR